MAAPLKFVANRLISQQNNLTRSTFCRSYAKKTKMPRQKTFLHLGQPIKEDSTYFTGLQKSDRLLGLPPREKTHPETPKPGQYEVNPPKGAIFDKKPFPMDLEAGKRYKWCSCGYSKSQPICDGSHKHMFRLLSHAKSSNAIMHEPVTFEVEKDGRYWLCNCKQTSNRPFCDGTHRREDIQLKIKT
ncbi:uncharacterized protein LOC128236895 [Mya arenaria]|uniref:uncharacterized protein LOC128236895 n=1 Tax=Mya arenaria TaxID=6604 RepID=UPI0022E81BF4|nr:uncharacterized protein LOC128236895 [Mya arenaria]